MRRSREVLNYRNVERFASYFNGNSKSITQLNEAYSKGNEGEILNIIKMNSAFKFVGNLMTIYNPLIKELARVILNKYGSSTYKSHITRFEPVKKSKKIKLVTYKRNKKTYKRAKKKRWTKREETFLKTHKKLKNKQLVKKFNSFFGGRRYGSIISKKYRIKGDKK